MYDDHVHASLNRMMEASRYSTTCRIACVALALAATGTAPAWSQSPTIPHSAEAGRLTPQQKLPQVQDRSAAPAVTSPEAIIESAPSEAKDITFAFKGVKFNGVTIFSAAETDALFAPYIDQTVSLDIAWKLAAKLTEKYRNAGYFLSRAYVPAQEIENGVVTINVVEGYIGKIDTQQLGDSNRITDSLVSELLDKRPVRAQDVENFLLLLNDANGGQHRGTLLPLKNQDEASVLLTVSRNEDTARPGSVSFDNYGSRYLGPHQLSASYQLFWPGLQNTRFSSIASWPIHELKHAALEHNILLTPRLKLFLTAETTFAQPGETLKEYAVKSEANAAGIGLQYQWIRQRTENLRTQLVFDMRNTDTQLLYSKLTHDQIRAMRANVMYDTNDRWNGYSIASVTLSQGLGLLGSSDPWELNLSRANAKPDFRKAELYLTRQQWLANNLTLQTSLMAQYASGTLYSSEQFGYGGQNFGRAYDNSDITGDDGIAAALELRYNAYADQDYELTPYSFYDIGSVWNKVPGSVGQKTKASGSSAGAGLRLNAPYALSANLGFAVPLTRDVADPIYRNDEDAPRVLLQINKSF